MSTLVLYAMIFPDRLVSVWNISNIKTSVNTRTFVFRLTPPAVSAHPFLRMVGVIPQPLALLVVVLCDTLAVVIRDCVRQLLQIHVREDFEIVVDTTVVVFSAKLVSVYEQPSMDVNACEELEIGVDVSVGAGFDSLQTTPAKDVSFNSMESLTDTEQEVVMPSPEIRLEDHVIRVGVKSESAASIGGLEGKDYHKTER